MVTQNGNLPIGIVVLDHLFGRRQACKRSKLFRLDQLILKSLGSIVGTKDFGSQAAHELLEMLIQQGRVDLIKNFVRLFLLLAKLFQVFIDLTSHSVVVIVKVGSKVNRLLEEHGIFTEKLEFNLLVVAALFVGIKGHVLDT